MDTSTQGMETPSESRTKQIGPKYDDATRAVIERFIGAMVIEFQGALEGYLRLVGRDMHHPRFYGQIMYYRHAIAAMKFAFHRARGKQNHLVNLENETLERSKQEWLQHLMTLEREAGLPQSASPTTDSRDQSIPGGGLKNGPSVNSATPARKRSRLRSGGHKKAAS